MWDLPGPGIEPVPPAMAGGFFFFLIFEFYLLFIQQVISYLFYTY